MALTLVIGNKNYSSWSLRPWLALKQFGLEFEEVRIPLDQPETAARIRQYSAAGRVPVLLDDGITVWDSLAICHYLADRFPTLPWFPTAPAARAIAYSISAEMHAGFQALRQALPMNCRARFADWQITPAVQQDIDRITAIWQACRQGGEGEFLFGDFTIADALYAPVVSRFITYQVPLDPVCTAYAEAILTLPAMQAWQQAAEAETEEIPAYDGSSGASG